MKMKTIIERPAHAIGQINPLRPPCDAVNYCNKSFCILLREPPIQLRIEQLEQCIKVQTKSRNGPIHYELGNLLQTTHKQYQTLKRGEETASSAGLDVPAG